MAFGSAQLQADRSINWATALCAFVLPVVLAIFSLDAASATDATGRTVGSTMMESDLVTSEDSRHSHDDCGHGHESPECSPCSSCSAGMPSATGPTPDVMIVLRASALKAHFDDVVPEGIRRPPRPS